MPDKSKMLPLMSYMESKAYSAGQKLFTWAHNYPVSGAIAAGGIR